jgi:hypothetical protein
MTTTKRTILPLLLMMALSGCGKDSQITEISLERRGCFGPCRVYKVTLRKDGSATYVGRENVDRIGTFTNDRFWPIASEFTRLADAIDKAGFFRLANVYAPGWVDAEVVVTTVVRNGRARAVTTHNSANDPKELWFVNTLIDGVAAEVHWKEQE